MPAEAGRPPSTPAPEILVLGGSGYLGRNILAAAAAVGMRAVGFSRTAHGPLIANDRFAETAAADGVKLVISCAGLASVAACDRDPAAARHANVDFTGWTATVCRDLGIPLVWMSTDGMFTATGLVARYHAPMDTPAPSTEYARSKLEGERTLRELGWGHCVRASFVGPSLGTGRGMLASLVAAHRAACRSMSGFADVWFNPVSTDFLASQLLRDARYRLPGFSIVHLGCRPAVTKDRFLATLAARAGLDVTVNPTAARGLSPAVPLDQSLHCMDWQPLDSLLDDCVRALEIEMTHPSGSRRGSEGAPLQPRTR